MCGRFTLVKKEEEITQRFRINTLSEKLYPRYNAAPGQSLPIVTNLAPKALQFFKWGLIPGWAKDEASASKAVNARVETVIEKPSFQHAFQHQRCLVIADGYFEWKTHGKDKIPYRITLEEQKLFAMAGLWEKWVNPKGKDVFTFTIVTVPAHPKIAHLHDRMPAILSPLDEQFWLSEEELNDQERLDLLHKPVADEIKFYTVSKRVSNVKFDTPDLIRPVNYHIQGSLF